MPKGSRPRRGFALVDVIIGGVMLAIGLGVVLTVSGRSLAMQANGEKRLVASWLCDEMLNMVLVEGPDVYPQIHDTNGRFDEPFQDFTYDLNIDDQGPREAYRVTATVFWQGGRDTKSASITTLIARRLGDPLQNQRRPLEYVDREERWYQKQYGEDAIDAPAPAP